MQKQMPWPWLSSAVRFTTCIAAPHHYLPQGLSKTQAAVHQTVQTANGNSSSQFSLLLVQHGTCCIFTSAGPVKGAALVRLAFVTLGRYDFAYNPKYLEPVKMLGYLDDENESIRRAAALAFCRVQHRNAKLQKVVRSKRDRAGSHYPLVAKVLPCLYSCGTSPPLWACSAQAAQRGHRVHAS